MASNSSIEWTGSTWNPITGCTRVSEGCRHCYAERMARRLQAMGQPQYQGTVDKNGRWTGKVNFVESALEIPLKRKKPTTWFVNSMSDLFHPAIHVKQLTDIFEVMARTPQHTYQILTKRADRLMPLWDNIGIGVAFRLGKQRDPGFWPLKNVWLGVSVENQAAADERIPFLLRTPAAIRFLSCEPLLGAVDLSGKTVQGVWIDSEYANLDPGLDEIVETEGWPIHWVIAGGESGPHARPMHPQWARSIRDQCQAADVPFFFKQHGEWIARPEIAELTDEGWRVKPEWRAVVQNRPWGALDINGKLWDSTTTWNGRQGDPRDGYEVTVYRVGKKAAGRLLDGREWSEFPA